jgi:SAM-dependent methyltransferase
VDDLLRATALAEARHFWFRGFRRFVTPMLEHATQGISDARLLDCGCGTGNNLALLSQFGRAYGFDLSEVGLRFGRDSGRRLVARASVAAAPFPGDAFDVVTSFDVLYSLDDEDERAAVHEMHRVVKRGGYAIVNVAAMDLLRGDHSILSKERRRYKREQLRALMTRAGFEVVRLTHTNAVLFPPMLVARTIQRIRGLAIEEKAHGEITVPPAPINALLTGALHLESYAIRFFDSPVGSSLLCLARKDG